MTSHVGYRWIFTLQNKRCKFNMAASAVYLPRRTGLIVCLGEFLRGMGNVSNIYCRAPARGDTHGINLTWTPQRQKQEPGERVDGGDRIEGGEGRGRRRLTSESDPPPELTPGNRWHATSWQCR